MKRFLAAMLMVLLLTVTFQVDSVAEGYMHTLNRVNVRAEPSISSKILGYLVENEIVWAISVTTDSTGKPWVYADTKFGRGYVSAYSLGKSEQKVQKSIDHISSAQRVKLVAKSDTKAYREVDGKSAKVKAGTKVTARYFYPSKHGVRVLIEAPDGTPCFVSAKAFLTSSGKKIPNLPKKVKLKVDMCIGGELVQAGTKLNVEYYLFYKGELVAYCHEGYVPVRYWTY